MKRSLFVLAIFLITPFLAFALVRLVAPGIYSGLMSGGFLSFFLPAWGALFLLMCAVVALVIRRNRRIATAFDELIAGLGFERKRFFGREYASGTYGGLRTVLNMGVAQKSGFFPALPGGRLVVLCAVKAPGTAGVNIHLAVTGEPGSGLRSVMGWVEAAPGMYLMLRGGQSREQALGLFATLSGDTLAALADASRKYVSVALTAGWDVLMLGRKRALVLSGGDENALSCLEVRAAVTLDAGRGRLAECLDALSHIAALAGRDLSGPRVS